MKWLFVFVIVTLFGSGLFLIEHVGSAATVSSTVTTIPSTVTLTERQYRWYRNEDNLTPTVPLASENTATSTPDVLGQIRLRMNLGDSGLTLVSGATFLLQYATVTSGPWTSVASSTAWTFLDNPGVADGQIIVTTVLSASDVGESYGESNPSAASPNDVLPTQEGEWDWSLVNTSAATSSSWFFRMIQSSGTVLDSYETYPTLTSVPTSTPPPPPPPPPPPAPGGGGSGGGGITIIVGPKPPSPCESEIVARIDLSGDCKVDMVDLSILVYYYDRVGPAIARYDFSGNGRVDLFDVSVMMYYWTD